MLITLINTLLPVFLIIVLGWLLYRFGFLSAGALHEINRLTYWIGVPCLLFQKIATAEQQTEGAGAILLVVLLTTAIGIALAYLLAFRLRLPSRSVGTFVQGLFRGNLAFVGLPVVLYAFAGPANSAIQSAAVLALGPMVVVYNVAAVLVLIISRESLQRQMLKRLLNGLITNPLLAACLLGVLYSYLALPLPQVADRTLGAIGQMALPLALLCIGGTLAAVRVSRAGLVQSTLAAAGKTLLLPLIGGLIAWLAGLDQDTTRIALIMLACPTASASYILARQLGGDEVLASGTIFISVLLSAPALAIVMLL